MPALKATGIDNLWIPPGCKGANQQGNGYDIYDLWDLGEFEQKGSVSTKWGTKDDLFKLIHYAKDVGIGIYWDAVLNQKAGADRTEQCQVVEVDPKGRPLGLGSKTPADLYIRSHKSDHRGIYD